MLFHLSWLSAMVPIGKWFRYFVNKGGAGRPTGPLHSKGLNPMICEYRGALYLSMAPYMAASKSHPIRHSIRTALVLGNPLQFWELPPTMQVVKLWDTEATRVPLSGARIPCSLVNMYQFLPSTMDKYYNAPQLRNLYRNN